MKKLFTLSIAVMGAAVLLFNSCSMEKRHYMKGYHMEWNHNNDVVSDQQASGLEEPVNAVVNSSADAATAQSIISEPSGNIYPEKTGNVTTPAVKKTAGSPTASVKKNAEAASSTATKAIVSESTHRNKDSKNGRPDKGLLIVLAILIPWLAVGLATDWDVKQVVINLLLCLTCIGGIIHALIVVSKNS